MRDLPPRPVTVLVAGDDDREDTKQLLRELTTAGYELRWVASAEEAARAPYAIVSTRALGELAELRHDALHDALTGLPNRALFLDRLELSLKRSRRHEDEFCCAVLFCDLDRFKLVNDSLGHLVGDRLLMAVAKRIEGALRPGDTVARHGGDEFTLLLEEIDDVRGASIVAERLQETLAAPFHVDHRELYVSASIGIALVTADRAPEDVVRDADVAMYRAKAQGGARHAVFDEAMHARVMQRLELETGLRHALDRGQLRVLYQPVIETATGTIAGFEALCRWTDGTGKAIEPREFVPIADETGLILPLGRFVFDEACRQLAIWRKHPRGKQHLGLGQRLAPPALRPRLRRARHRRAGRRAARPARAAARGRRELDDGRPRRARGASSAACSTSTPWRRGSTTSASARHPCASCTASPATRSSSTARSSCRCSRTSRRPTSSRRSSRSRTTSAWR